jgi:hypothetical protein
MRRIDMKTKDKKSEKKKVEAAADNINDLPLFTNTNRAKVTSKDRFVNLLKGRPFFIRIN